MRKRLFSILLAVMMVVSVLGVVPAHAAQMPDGFQTVSSAVQAGARASDGSAALPETLGKAPEQLRMLAEAMQSGAPASDGADVMTANAFQYLVALCKTGTRDGNLWYTYDEGELQDGLAIAYSLTYNADYNVIFVYSWFIEDGENHPITAVMEITNAAEAPFTEELYYDEDESTIGIAYITCDYNPDASVYFSAYYGEQSDAANANQYNSYLCTAMIGYLAGALRVGNYTLEDLGLVAAARFIDGNNQTPFNDVRTTDFYYTPVLWAIQKGITNGTSDNRFSPNDTCTRAQVVTFLWRAAGSPAPKSTRNPFRDVNVNEWYGKAVLWAVEKGITNGTSSTTFSPNQGCTRGQVVTFLQRALNGKATSTSNPFRDVSSSEYYYNAVLWAVQKGITNGVDATRFGPNNTCTRGQIVTFLYRAYR